jgi:ribonuclease-3
VSDGDETQRALEGALDYRFRERELADTALSHPSHAHERDGSRGNERLEFLGDAVLDLVVAEALYAAHPDWREGQLTRARASLVNKSSLAACARALGLPELVRLGKTERRSDGASKDSILANCLEAVVGAVYLDGGLAAVEPLIARWFGDAFSSGTVPRDAKTAFQEWAHSELKQTPTYDTTGDSGVENDDDRFTVEVHVEGRCWGRGVGRTKRAAETAAAKDALARARKAT